MVLDRNGAEVFLGMGDMLFLAGDRSRERIQGAYMSTAEVPRVVELLEQRADTAYNLDILPPEDEEGEGGFDEAAMPWGRAPGRSRLTRPSINQ